MKTDDNNRNLVLEIENRENVEYNRVKRIKEYCNLKIIKEYSKLKIAKEYSKLMKKEAE
jgi:hypothetical protein